MKKKLRLLIMENRRIIPGIAVIGVLAVLLLVRWGYNRHQSAVEEISAYNEVLRTSSLVLARGSEVEKLIGIEKKRIKELEKGLLRASKPSIAAAELQEAFKKLVKKKKISISSENVLNFEEEGDYIRIPVEFHLRAGLSQLTRLLYDVQASALLMGVRSLRIRGPNSRNKAKMNVTLVLEGAIKTKGGGA
ncbi:MAG: type II secretion system protein GspM [Thermodesulfobacteriota bacterium]